MKNIVFAFDGQGAFRPGVGKELCKKYPEAKELIHQSGNILGYDLTEYLWGQKATNTSNKTSIAQPAISVLSLAYAEVLKNLGVTPDVSLGHSLGEVTAIVYCGVVSFPDGIKIIQKRGEVMERGGKEGTMMAVVNMDMKSLEEACKNVSQEISEPVVVANINAPNQIVISGSQDGIMKVAHLAAKKRARGIPLKVGGAWHSPYLKEVAKEFEDFLETIPFNQPTSKFYSVVDQKIEDDGLLIKDALKRQMLSQVNWVVAIENLQKYGYHDFLEIGPSKILKDLISKISPTVRTESTALYTELETLVQNL